MFGGETREPLRVFNEVTDEIGRLLKDGPDTALFDRIKKAAIGGHIRALNSFGIIASSISEGHFRDFDSYKAPEILTKVSIDDIMNFIRENLIPDNMAISIINPIDEVMN
jgi:predicted Zn-dependent peptidase